MDRRTAQKLMVQLRRDAAILAARFGLRLRSLDAERPNVNGHYGICYSDGTIRIRLRHAVTGQPLKYSSLVNTLCHELAHLRYFDHGIRFQQFYALLLEYARDQGIYRPGRPAVAEAQAAMRSPAASRRPARTPPQQLSLFG